MARNTAMYLGLGKRHRVLLTTAGIAAVVILGIADFITGYEASFSIFYLGPISALAWFVGRRAGLMIALISALVWLAADIVSGHIFTHPLIPFWNAGVRLGFFTIVVIILSNLRLAYDAQVRLASELRQALDNVKVLSGLIPICAWCKRVRDDKGYWQQVEAYITDHSEASFSHAVCPECRENLEKQMHSTDQKSNNG
jgi:hypothetical protein